jgi:hypothetical protein
MNNRSITLDGANKIFSAIGVSIEHHQLGFYQTTYQGKPYQSKTLTELCQILLITMQP